MNALQILSQYRKTLEGPFTISDYAKSDGTVSTITCRFTSYHTLKRDTLLRLLTQLANNRWEDELRNSAFTMAMDMVTKAFDPGPWVNPATDKLQTLEWLPPGSLCSKHVRQDPDDPDLLVLLNLESMDTQEREADPEDLTKSRNRESRNKKIITATLPLRRFIPRINLRHGKFTDIVPAV